MYTGIQSQESDLSLVIVMNELPIPAVTGGRLDPWTRAKLFKKFGCRLMLITWTQEVLKPSVHDELSEVFDRVLILRNSRGIMGMAKRLFHLPYMSPHISSRIPSSAEREMILNAVDEFSPNAIWLDGVYGAVVARDIRDVRNLPLFYRSHNIEFRYMRGQAQQADNLRDRIAWNLAALNLQRTEADIQIEASTVFDISSDDMAFWKARGVVGASWLPTVFEAVINSPPIAYYDRRYDVAFLGGLKAPNNKRAVLWFLESVLPIIKRSAPGIRTLIAGSNPEEDFKIRVNSYEGVDLIGNVARPEDVLRDARVLINPIHSGSGLNVKSIEMLHFDSHLVTTNLGARGLPIDVRQQFLIADTPSEFAAKIIEALPEPFVVGEGRRLAREQFSYKRIEDVIRRISSTSSVYKSVRADFH